VKRCSRVYLEAYTSVLMVPKERLVPAQRWRMLALHVCAKHTQLCCKVTCSKLTGLGTPRDLTASTPLGRSRAERARRRLGGVLRQGGRGSRPRDGGVRGGQDPGRR